MICFLIHLVDVEHQICPVLIELCSIDSTDDFRTEAVTVSSCNFPYTLLPPFSQLILPHNYLPTHFYPPPFPLSSRFHFPILVLPFPVLPFYEKSFYFHYLLTYIICSCYSPTHSPSSRCPILFILQSRSPSLRSSGRNVRLWDNPFQGGF